MAKRNFKKAVTEACNQLRWHFYLNSNSMHLHWEIDDRFDGHHNCVARVEWDSVYLELTITFFKPAYDLWLASKRDELFHVLVHEFTHTLNMPLVALVEKHISTELRGVLQDVAERQTELTTRVMLGGFERARKELK